MNRRKISWPHKSNTLGALTPYPTRSCDPNSILSPFKSNRHALTGSGYYGGCYDGGGDGGCDDHRQTNCPHTCFRHSFRCRARNVLRNECFHYETRGVDGESEKTGKTVRRPFLLYACGTMRVSFPSLQRSLGQQVASILLMPLF